MITITQIEWIRLYSHCCRRCHFIFVYVVTSRWEILDKTSKI